MPSLAVILPAAGSSTRFGGASKLLAPLADGLSVIACTLQRILSAPDVASVVIAMPADAPFAADLSAAVGPALRDRRVRHCPGGRSRAESVRNALAHVPAELEWVAVHDAARPLVSLELLRPVVDAAVQYGAAIPALPIVPTIKQAEGPLPAKVLRTVPRQTLWGVQTPQVARRAALEAAFASCTLPLDEVTDEAQLLELAGQDVWLVPGDERNLKITTPDDLRLAQAFLAAAGGRS